MVGVLAWGREGISAGILVRVTASVFARAAGPQNRNAASSRMVPRAQLWLGASPPSGCEGIYRRLCGEEDGMDKGVRGKLVEGEGCSGIF